MCIHGINVTKIGPIKSEKDEKIIVDALWLMTIPNSRYKIFGEEGNRTCVLNFDFDDKKKELFTANFKGALELATELNKEGVSF